MTGYERAPIDTGSSRTAFSFPPISSISCLDLLGRHALDVNR